VGTSIVSVLAVAALGSWLLLTSHAATSSIVSEAESGVLGGAAQVVSDTGASDGAAVQFRQAYYVSSGGNDSNNGSVGSPWKTIQKAVDTAPAQATIIVSAGTYAHFSVTRPNLAITAASGANVIVTGAAGVRDVVLIAANNVSVSNLTVSGCVPSATPATGFETSGSSQVRISDNTSGVSLDHLSIHDSHGINSDGLPFGCYGIAVENASNATIANSEIYHNGYGIFVYGGGSGDIFQNNSIHDNDVIIVNTLATDDDYGGVGIGFTKVTAANPGPIVQNNTMYYDVGSSNDYGTDGGATEVYDASNVTFDHNTMHDNDNVFESGSGSTGTCNNNKFTNNTATGKTAGSTLKQSQGMLLRCASHMLIDSNSFTGISSSGMWITTGGSFSSSINGLTITHNTFDQTPAVAGATSENTYSLAVNPSGLGLVIDHNQYRYQKNFAKNWDGTTDASLAAWQAKTGFDANSVTY